MCGSIIFLALDRFSGGGTKFSQVQTGVCSVFPRGWNAPQQARPAHGGFTEPQANR